VALIARVDARPVCNARSQAALRSRLANDWSNSNFSSSPLFGAAKSSVFGAASSGDVFIAALFHPGSENARSA